VFSRKRSHDANIDALERTRRAAMQNSWIWGLLLAMVLCAALAFLLIEVWQDERGHITRTLSLLLLTVVAHLFLLGTLLLAMGETYPACYLPEGSVGQGETWVSKIACGWDATKTSAVEAFEALKQIWQTWFEIKVRG
jgi:hypothetical protein